MAKGKSKGAKKRKTTAQIAASKRNLAKARAAAKKGKMAKAKGMANEIQQHMHKMSLMSKTGRPSRAKKHAKRWARVNQLRSGLKRMGVGEVDALSWKG